MSEYLATVANAHRRAVATAQLVDAATLCRRHRRRRHARADDGH